MADRTVEVLLVGGGTASAAAAVELRARGFTGSVLLCGRELDPPYERPPISKGLLLGTSAKEDALHPLPEDVEVLTRTSVMKLDTEAREARLSTKETVGFEQALVATGALVRRLPIDGTDLDGIHLLRAPGNAARLREDVARADRVGIIGGSFIACEVAASLAEMGIASTLVFPEAAPLALQFGTQVGGVVSALLTEHGVEVRAGEQAERLEGDDGGRVARIVCASGATVECSAVVIAVGAQPDVMLARGSGLELGPTGGVRCSAQLETSAPGIFAAGDMCEYPSALHAGRPLRVEHHEVAAAQGRCAARNMLGAGEDFAEVPYFWSDLAGWLTLESVGPADRGWDAEEVRGSLAGRNFSVLFRREGELVAAVTAGRPADLDEVRAALLATRRAV